MLSDTNALHNSSSVARDLFIIFLSSSLLSLYALRLEAVIQTVEANLHFKPLLLYFFWLALKVLKVNDCQPLPFSEIIIGFLQIELIWQLLANILI